MNWPEDFINKIICGDCLEVMKEIPDKSCDITLTSPPFRGDEEQDKKRAGLSNVNGNYFAWYDKFIKNIFRITKEYILVFNSCKNLPEIIKRYETPYRILIWAKAGTRFSYKYEPIFIYRLNASYHLNRYIYSDLFYIAPIIGSRQICPHENPVKLYSRILGFFPENKIILDPCIGSGTTAVAAKNLKYRYIGIEINPAYCKIAEERSAQGVL